MKNPSGKPENADCLSLRTAALIIMITPLLMIAAREIPATLLVIVTLVLGAAGWRTGHFRAVGRDLVKTLTHPAGWAFVGLVVLMLASLTWSPVPARVHEAVGYGSLTIRGKIWQETIPFIWQKPFFGWGVEASHALAHLPEAAHLTQVQRDLLNWGHTHNAPLQTWLEIGAVGAALAAAALYFGIRALRALPASLLPYATITVITAFAVACISHGAWQAWWWALLGLIAAAYAMAIAAHFPDALRRVDEPGAEPSK